MKVLSILTVLAAVVLVQAAPVPLSSSSQMTKRNDNNNLALKKRLTVTNEGLSSIVTL
ncbi:hypothetical protein BGZ81_001610, partial [Podila clonocystis]